MNDLRKANQVKRKIVYHIGDQVTIVEPLRFVRCGYPLSLYSAAEEIEKHFGSDIRILFKKIGIVSGLEPNIHEFFVPARTQVYDKVLKELGYAWMVLKGFGGKERSIHTQLEESWRGKKFEVRKKRTVKTGIWSPGFGHDEEGFDPPYLKDEKTHVILEIDPVDHWDPMIIDRHGDRIEIEEIHVTKVLTAAEISAGVAK